MNRSAPRPDRQPVRGEGADARPDVDPDVARLLGLRPADADSIPSDDELDTKREMTDTRTYQGELEARGPDVSQPDDAARNLESLAADELREGETDDPTEAAEEGLTWVPPVDPPVVAGERGEPEVAAGFSTSAHDEPFDEDHHAGLLSPHDELEDRVLEALEAHAETAGRVQDLTVDVEGGRAVLGGTVEDLEDEDAVLAIAEEVPGIARAVSRLEVRSLAERPAR